MDGIIYVFSNMKFMILLFMFVFFSTQKHSNPKLFTFYFCCYKKHIIHLFLHLIRIFFSFFFCLALIFTQTSSPFAPSHPLLYAMKTVFMGFLRSFQLLDVTTLANCYNFTYVYISCVVKKRGKRSTFLCVKKKVILEDGRKKNLFTSSSASSFLSFLFCKMDIEKIF
jgi:hypothetical protein